MDYEVTRQGNDVVIKLNGKMTYRDHEGFRKLRELFGDGVRDMVLALASVSFIDSAGLGMLLILQDEAKRLGVSLTVRGATGQVRRVFVASEMSKVLNWQDIPQ